jgi:hypothetical protein
MTKPDTYRPTPGTRAHRAITWLASHPNGTRVSSAALAAAIGIDSSGLDANLRSAIRHGWIRREIGPSGHRLIWSLGPSHPGAEDDDAGDAPYRLLNRALRGGIVICADETPDTLADLPCGPGAADWRQAAPPGIVRLVDAAPLLIGALLSARQRIEYDRATFQTWASETEHDTHVLADYDAVLRQLEHATRIACLAP